MAHNGLSDYKIKKIRMFFCQDFTASKTAVLLGINRNTINLYFNEFCLKIPAYTHHKGSLFLGEIELDGSYLQHGA